MNFAKLSRSAMLAPAAIAMLALAACDRHNDESPPSAAASPSAQVIGVTPAAPTGDPPGTTPVASNTSDVTKTEESLKKPQEGDNHSYSTLAPETPQKAEWHNPQEQPDRKKND